MYGDNTRQLRECLSELLSHRRVQHRIGAARPPAITATTTPQERQQIGAQIARYRNGILTWCHQGLTAAADPHSGRAGGPAEELRYRLHASLGGDTAGPPSMSELTTEQAFPLIELWRHAARAAALGEHDFTAGAGYGRLSTAQSLALVHDAAEITRAVLTLDRHYTHIPGWQQVTHHRHLTLAAEACADYTRYRDQDYTLEQRGWTPPAQLIDGPGLDGVAGVLQAQHNLRLHLNTLPDAHSLRVVIDSQRIVSLHAARQLTSSNPEGAARWEHRCDVYGRLVRSTRDLAGTIGNGGPAAGQGALAAGRAQHLPQGALADPEQTQRLERLSAGIDHRVSTALIHGITEHLYHQRVNVLGLDQRDGAIVHVIKQRYQPVTEPLRGDLLGIATNELKPVPVQASPPPDAVQNRLDFRLAIDQRPGHPGPSLAL
ncbi:MAG: hypothetical protein GX643_09610 [Acidimicrobiales bacterium]|nr:hypothetical protein [Acidimicrobiales bacterium]